MKNYMRKFSLSIIILLFIIIFYNKILAEADTILNPQPIVTPLYEEKYIFVKQWGTQGEGEGQFNEPSGIAVDLHGNVYVSDITNECIQKFDSRGNYLIKWGSLGVKDGQFYVPIRIAVDHKENIYVADYRNDRIQKFDSNGNFLKKWRGQTIWEGQDYPPPSYRVAFLFVSPTDVSVDLEGNIFVADPCYYITKLNQEGNIIARWATGPTWDTLAHWDIEDLKLLQLGYHQLIDAFTMDSSGNIYVLSLFGRPVHDEVYDYSTCIQKFDPNGTFVTRWGRAGINDGEFYATASGIATDSRGNVYVADMYNHRIQKFDSNGKFITKWGVRGNGYGQFNLPSNLTVDLDGNVYVIDFGNYRIQKFTRINNH